MLLELCIANLESLQLIQDLPIQRIEYCTNLEVGGLTADLAEMKTARDIFSGKIIFMIHPQAGNYVYSKYQKLEITKQIEQTLIFEHSGVILGAAINDMRLDLRFLEHLRKEFPNTEFVFHRLFDYLSNPTDVMDELIQLDFSRILCSGTQGNAIDGLTNLKKYITHANNNITIMPGGGIRPSNIKTILEKTNAAEIHSAALPPNQNIIDINIVKELLANS